MELIKRELILREEIRCISLVERSYFKVASLELTQEDHITSYDNCMLIQTKNGYWMIARTNIVDTDEYNAIRKETHSLSYQEFYQKYCGKIHLDDISCFHNERVIVEREPD